MNPAHAQPGVRLEVRQLRRSYGGVPVLQDVSFTVNSGEIFVLMGPSGGGKSVLLRHLIGLEQPDSGEILIDGHSIHAGNLMDRYRLAMVFQSGALLNSLTVGENVGLYLAEHQLRPPEEIDRIVAEKLALVGLEGLEGRNPSDLSGGMKRRVAIARALAMDPQLLLYDEPTSELDPIMAATIGQEIYNLNQRTGVTSVVVTHDRDLAFGVADRIAVIQQGRILVIGTPEEVRRSDQPSVHRFLNVDFKIQTESPVP